MYVCDVHHAGPCTCRRYMDVHDVHHIRTYRYTLVDTGVSGRESEETEDQSTLITVYTRGNDQSLTDTASIQRLIPNH